MPINSKRKGSAGERELAAELNRLFGVQARRSQQYCGVAGDADVIGLPGFFVEGKRVERLNVPQAMLKAVAEAKEGEIPLLIHRPNRCKWLVTMLLDDLPEAGVKIFHLQAERHS